MRLLIAAVAAFFVSTALAETPIPKPRPCKTIEQFMAKAPPYTVGEHVDFLNIKFAHVASEQAIVVFEMDGSCIAGGTGIIIRHPSSNGLIEKVVGVGS